MRLLMRLHSAPANLAIALLPRRLRARAVLVAVAALGAALSVPSTAVAADEGLNPGGVTRFAERVPVNVVFVGMNEGDAPWSAVRSELASRSQPIVRSRAFYGIQERLGLDYTYDYRPHYTSQAWEDDFFGYLASIAVAKPVTDYQAAYNAQSGRLDVTGNHWIHAPSVEKRLIDAPPPQVDTRQPTVFFINWYGRSDFRFHVYSKTGEADPDTRRDFGAVLDSRKLVAWGGTTPEDEESGLGRSRGIHRVWFYDLSAGPESWGGSFDITNPDLDGDGVPDYRIPVSWEYGAYRAKAELPRDLGKVLRYVGLNLLFTSSPLYPPYLTADRLPDTVDLDVNTLEGWSGVDASSQYVTRDLFLSEERELPTGVSLTTDSQDLPFSGDLKRCYVEWIANVPCYDRYAAYPAFANLFLSAALGRSRFLDGDADHEAALLNYAVSDPALDPGFLGFADDNWLDGTQSGVFSFVYPRAVQNGYGLTTTMIHEYGHHSSLSHPHDGYDPATGVDYGPTGDFFFAWLGDESNSMMSYIDLNWDFSQFDRDNSARHHASGYALVANEIAQDILDSRHAERAAGELSAADRALRSAQEAVADHDYTAMLAHAEEAYRHVLAGADRADVEVRVRQPSTWTVVAPSQGARGSRIPAAAVDLAPWPNLKRVTP